MNFFPASNASVISFVLLYLVLMIVLFKNLLLVSNGKKWLISYILLTSVFVVLALMGIVQSYIIPTAPILLVGMMLYSFFFAFSKYGKNIAEYFSVTALLGIQSFRFPLELILHSWSKTKTVPLTMTWSGQNWDIIAGLICFLLIPFFKKNRFIVWFAQLMSFFLLINVIRVAIMSSPFPFSWELDPPLLLVAYFPYVLILPGFVAIALIGHLITFRKLLKI